MACLKGRLLGGFGPLVITVQISQCRCVSGTRCLASLWGAEGKHHRWARETGFQSEHQCAEIACHSVLSTLTAPGKQRETVSAQPGQQAVPWITPNKPKQAGPGKWSPGCRWWRISWGLGVCVFLEEYSFVWELRLLGKSVLWSFHYEQAFDMESCCCP